MVYSRWIWICCGFKTWYQTLVQGNVERVCGCSVLGLLAIGPLLVSIIFLSSVHVLNIFSSLLLWLLFAFFCWLLGMLFVDFHSSLCLLNFCTCFVLGPLWFTSLFTNRTNNKSSFFCVSDASLFLGSPFFSRLLPSYVMQSRTSNIEHS